ncbi:phage holin family protein [Arthrobacter sp. Sr33]
MSHQPTGGSPYSSPGQPPPSEAHEKAEHESLGSLLGDVSRDISTLMRQELELAKAELRETGTQAGKGAGMLGGAGIAGHFVLLFLSLALMWGLGDLIGLGWSSVIVAVLWGIVAAVLAMKGKKELKAVRGMPDTAETLKEVPPTLKPGEHTP